MNQVRSMTLLAACVCLCVGAFVAVAWARQIDTSFPPVFSQLTLGEAKQKAMEQDRILVVKGTAGWCGPCRTMDKTTWRDAKVEAWFKEKGIAIQLNVDRSAKEAQALRIQAIPAMVAFKGDKEIGRIVGLQTAEQLLAWLGRIEGGEKGDSGLLDRLRKVRADPKTMSMQDRMKLAEELAEAGEVDQAADEYVWLWGNMESFQRSMSGVRVSFMAGDMQRLAEDHPAAMAKFRALRDSAWGEFENKGIAAEFRERAIGDWAHLNRVVGESDRTLAWYDDAAGKPENAEFVREISNQLERLFEEAGRWADLGRSLKTPAEEIESSHRIIDFERARAKSEDRRPMAATIRQVNERKFRDDMGRAHAAYLAAGREDDASAVAEGAINKDDTPAMRVTLVRWAIKAKQVRESQRAWLDEAAAAGDDWPGVRSALDKAFKEQGDSEAP
jgi:thiol-disulfide isomerase/thioredoxin